MEDGIKNSSKSFDKVIFSDIINFRKREYKNLDRTLTIKTSNKRRRCKMMKYDLHVHTLASGHAFNTIWELASYAKKNNVEVIGIIDHGPSMEGASHLGYFEMLKWLPEKIEGVRIISGCEANVIDLKGNIDLPLSLQKELDFIAVGLHKRTPFPEKTDIRQNTKALIRAIQKNRIHMVAHPYRLDFPINVKQVYGVAKEYKVLFELNLSLLKRYGNSKKLLEQIFLMLELIKSSNDKIVVASDAHVVTEVGDNFILKSLGIDLPANLVLGAVDGYQEITEFLKRR